MKNLKTFEGFLDKFRPNTSYPLPEPEEKDIKGESIRGKDLEDLVYRVIRDIEGDMDLYIDNNYLEFIDINEEKIICSFSGIPEPGQTIDEDGNILDDEESENCECPMLYYDVNGNYLEVYKNRHDKLGNVEFSFSLRVARDVTDILDDDTNIIDEE